MHRIDIAYTEDSLLQYKDWIQATGISVAWDYYKFMDIKHIMYEFVNDEDAVAFKLVFKL